MTKSLVIYPERCVGCESCTLACSFFHEQQFNRSKSRIKINYFWKEGNFVPVTCNQCENAPCLNICPVGALYRAGDRTVILDYNKCIGCRLCVSACPFGAMILPPGKGVPIKCDLCSGDPQCVKICEVHAIEYVDTTEIRAERRKETARTLIIKPVELRKKKSREYGEPSPWSPPDYEDVEPIP